MSQAENPVPARHCQTAAIIWGSALFSQAHAWLFLQISFYPSGNTNRHGCTGTCNYRCAADRRYARHREVAARDRRSPGPARQRPRDVLLHFFAFLQSCAGQFLVRHHGSVASFPRLVVANPDRQFHALCRRSHAFFPGALGALSAPALSLHGDRNYPAGIWTEYSAADRKSSWDHATGRCMDATHLTMRECCSLTGSTART